MALLGYLGGYRSSSTRIGLVGTIMALLSNFPIHLAVDNQMVVTKADAFRKWLLDHSTEPPPGPPMSLVKNGDLWTIFYKQLAAKGPEVFSNKKAKGHAIDDKSYCDGKLLITTRWIALQMLLGTTFSISTSLSYLPYW